MHGDVYASDLNEPIFPASKQLKYPKCMFRNILNI